MTPVTSRANPLRVYLVEDSPIMARLLRELLQGDEFWVQVVGQATTASIAIAKIRALAPDVAIIDLALENGTGFDVIRALGEDDDSRPVVVVLSNFATQRYRKEAKRLGADYFFDKSTEVLKLLETICAISRGANRKASPE